MRLLTLLLLLATCLAQPLSAQKAPRSASFFTDIAERELPNGGERRIVPQRYRAVRLDVGAVQAFLQKTPLENTAAKAAQLPVLTLPMPDGSTARFRIAESPVMEDALQQKYPETRCYTGRGIDDPSATLSCDLTPWGFHAMILSACTGTVFIDPYTHGDREHYSVYYKKDYQRNSPDALFSCSTDDEHLTEVKEGKSQNPDFQGDCRLRTYRLALACTGEYAGFHGNTKPLVLAAMNTTMNRVNGVYRRELSITMKLVAKNDTLLFFNASSDPYSNTNGSAMLDQNRTTCNARIGVANFDIGHVFSTGGGGVASLASVCGTNKARGVTGSDQPIGDAFDIDYVAHEMGHQFGGPHTFNGTLGSCGGGNINAPTAVEPGSGTTIMAYAGICGAHNVQNNSDDYFHASSLQSIGVYTTTGAGNGCAVKTTTGNNAPTVNAGADYIIPKSTPFALTATAEDIDGDTLSYCWEGMDIGSAAIPPVATNTTGAMFRTFKPGTSPTRYFPRLSDLNGNVNYSWEELPSVARVLKFRITVRDNNFGSGCTEEDDMTVTVNATAGPLQVTAPNTNIIWLVGETRTVTWNVAGTDLAPISCANVRLLLSNNGGLSYPIVLAASVPNNGSADVLVPNNVSPLCRVKVEAIGNIFYDISNANFRIQQPTVPTFLITAPGSSFSACADDTTAITLNLTSIAGFANPVQLSATGGPAGADIQFSPNPVTPSGNVTMTLSGITAAMAGPYSLVVKGESGTLSVTLPIALTVLPGKPGIPAPSSPTDGAVGLPGSVLLDWAAAPSATTYSVQVASNPSFAPASIVASGSNISPDSLLVNGLLSGVHYWRVLATNECGSTDFSPTYAFQVGKGLCDQTFSSTDTPKLIDPNSISTISSTINVPIAVGTNDLNVRIEGEHTWVGDLIGWVVNPAGKKAQLFHQVGVPSIDEFGCPGEDLDLIFDDEATSTAVALDTSCSVLIPALTGNFQPIQPLSGLEGGKTVKGDWTLMLRDTFDEDGGQLLSWSLIFCFPDTVAPGKLLTNLPLGVPTGGTAQVTNAFLRMATSGTAAQGKFTLLSLPQHGTLSLSGMPLSVGSVFTQNDINTGLLAYAHSGNTSTTDQFRFDILDENAQAWLHDAVFQIVILKNDLVITAAQTKAVPCYNGTGGEITASATGLNGSYQYSLNGGPAQSSPVFGGLAPGTYTIVVSGQFGYTAAASPVTLANPALLQASTSVADNDLTASAIGGTGAYEYSLNGGAFQASGLFENLANGPYTLTARDANGCTATASATVAVNTLVVSAVLGKNVACFGGSDGSLSVTVSGGQMPYLYSLNGGPSQLSPLFGGLSAGTYTVVVTDNQGFTRTTAALDVKQPATALATTASVNDNDLSAASTGGTPPVQYSIDGTAFQSSILFENLVNGIYTLTARDVNGCTATTEGIVAVNSVLASTSVLKNATCFGGFDGSLSVTAAGGQQPYQYSLNGGMFQLDNTFTGLSAGTYTIEVKDNQGFVATAAAVQIAQPAAVTASTSTALNIITITATGGTGALTYSLDGMVFQPNPQVAVLASGIYTLTVRDASGCTGTTTATVTIPALTATAMELQPILCFGGTTNVALSGSGGVPPYQYRLGNGAYQPDNAFLGLSAGMYTFFVLDAVGVVDTTTLDISQPLAYSATVTVVGKTATLNVTGNNPPYTYELNGTPNAPLQNLKNGEYVLVVSDASGCTKELFFEVNYTVLSATAQTNDPDICDEKLDITVTPAGGVPPYEYALNTLVFGPNPLFVNVQQGINTIRVRDAQGEIVAVAVNFNLPETLNIVASTVGDSIVASASGGVGPFTYALNNGTPVSDPVFANLPTGTYTVTAIDSRGCSASASGLSITSGIVEPGAAWGVSVSPNPGSGLFRLTLAQAPASLRAEVLDATGRLLRSLDFAPGSGDFQTLLDLTDLPQGLYALRLTDGQHWGALKLSVVR